MNSKQIRQAEELLCSLTLLIASVKADTEKERKLIISVVAKAICGLPSTEQWKYLSDKLSSVFHFNRHELDEMIESAHDERIEANENRKKKAANDLIAQAINSGPKMLMNNYFTVEGNAELNQLHISDIGKTVETNLVNFAQRKDLGWALIGVFKTHEEASEFCQMIRGYIMPYDDSATQSALANKI